MDTTAVDSGPGRDLRDRAKALLPTVRVPQRRIPHGLAVDRRVPLDETTGLVNRRGAALGLAEMVEHHDFETLKVVVIRLELEGLRAVSDAYGEPISCAVTRSAAQAVTSAAHAGDIVARSSESSLVVCCPHLSSNDEARRLAERLRCVVAHPVVVGAAQVALRAMAGIVVADRTGDAAEELLHKADLAASHLRENAGAEVSVYDETLQHKITRQVEIEALIRQAIASDEISLAYQPVVQIADQAIIGAEALLRLVDDEGKPVPAPEAIDVAERTGLISNLGLVILRTACREAARWQHLHPERAIGMAVNVSASQLHDGSFPDHVEATLATTGLHPARLTLEMTETVLMADSQRSTRQLARLKMSGVHLSADDFGTGYSSLAYLKRFPLDVIKADLSFVAGLPDSPEDVAIVSAIIAMANAVGLDVVAEGVENIRQLEELDRLGCGYGQGYLWSRAVPGDQLLELLERSLESHEAPDVAIASRERGPSPADLDDSLQTAFRTFAHEVRGPLTVMTGWASLVEVGALPLDDHGDAGARIRRAGERIDRLLGNLDDVLALEDGRLVLDAGAEDLREVVGQILDEVGPRMIRPVLFDRGEAGPLVVHIDVARIGQVLTNLVANAVKFSPDGAPVEVVVGRHDNWADVSVLDQGPGIDDDDVALAFRKYGRIDRTIEGSGMGLYLARGIARAHGGDVCYQRRTSPSGSIFNLRLPAGADLAGSAGAVETPSGDGRSASRGDHRAGSERVT